jgi:hypothetical protein
MLRAAATSLDALIGSRALHTSAVVGAASTSRLAPVRKGRSPTGRNAPKVASAASASRPNAAASNNTISKYGSGRSASAGPRAADGGNRDASSRTRAAPKAKPPREGVAPRNADGAALYPLKPNVLVGRLKELFEANNIDGAIHALKNSPADAQNTPVWNTVIWECMKMRKWTLAYKLYVDVGVRCLLIGRKC